jgi:hypothetical protein
LEENQREKWRKCKKTERKRKKKREKREGGINGKGRCRNVTERSGTVM